MSVVLAVVSDTHAGSTVAAMPDEVALDDGQTVGASKAQRWLFQCWREFWDEVARVRNEVRPALFGALFNGDLTEGQHHNSTQVLSGNPEVQSKILTAVLNVPLALTPDALWFVRGTPAHVGGSGAPSEEGTARRLRDAGWPIHGDPDTGSASWWHFRGEFEGVLLDVAHQGRTGQREHTRQNAANLYAHDILLSHVKRGDRHPDLCLRAHHHKFNDSFDACPVRVVTTGAWQLATEYVHKTLADSVADIGGALVIIRDGQYEVRKLQYRPSRGSIWRAA